MKTAENSGVNATDSKSHALILVAKRAPTLVANAATRELDRASMLFPSFWFLNVLFNATQFYERHNWVCGGDSLCASAETSNPHITSVYVLLFMFFGKPQAKQLFRSEIFD